MAACGSIDMFGLAVRWPTSFRRTAIGYCDMDPPLGFARTGFNSSGCATRERVSDATHGIGI
jgi:hypothetical protein